ncbi:xanthine dehydrogenase accessory protein XdhC [Cognatishimia sp. MH4019]|uniref:xanthine dehydrogenase accessory protein XdhC n=1 Tax=Cognatishimia sp. MH4019 TaxID=2854030 RepID=UPI001CD7187D|nr:xanthine dehydrogenase accessory protein XdhC [Cognatishimia sp. MH4019]
MTLADFLSQHSAVITVTLTRVRGSSPREVGATMYVADNAMRGTIGGGQLEYMAIDKARALLRKGVTEAEMDVPLGPEIGQCCGGRVELSLTLMDRASRAAALEADAKAQAARPVVQIHGAGHVGRALAQFFAHLPVRAILIDSRADELSQATDQVEHCLCPLPEAELRQAPAGSAFIVLTHDHALDFLLASEALARGDAAYVGMIGSATKRARFDRFCRDTAPHISTAALTCPMGAQGSADKRPEIIAAFITAEVMAALTSHQNSKRLHKNKKSPNHPTVRTSPNDDPTL